MKTNNLSQRKKAGAVITAVGAAVMALLSLTQLVASLRWAAFSVFLGVALFFIVRIIEKTPRAESGLNFKSVFSDMKKPGVFIWMLIPMFVTSVIPFLIGDLLLKNGYAAYSLERIGGMVSVNSIPLLVFEVVILALGEEIAWRGFFVGKTMKRFPFLLCASVSSVLFALGHVADGELSVVLFNSLFVFADSMIFAVIFKKSGNCVVSTLAHIIGNAVGLAVCLIAF